MTALARKNLKIFGNSAASGDIRQYGSLAAGAPITTTDPETIQALAQYDQGWRDALMVSTSGSLLPTLEDTNSLHYLETYQLAYLFQSGIPEWIATATYCIGSFCQVSGIVYQSLIDTNLNHAPGSTLDTDWSIVLDPVYNYFNNSSTKARSYREYSDGTKIITQKWNGATWDDVAYRG